MSWRARGLSFGFALLAGQANAEPPTKVACAEAHGESQSLRNAGKLTDARAHLVSCSDAACPGVLKKECAGWLEEVDRAMPSVVLGAKGAHGDDVVEVKVSLDGRSLVARLDGMPIAVDPGVHTLRFEAAGMLPVEQRVTVRLGEKNRRVDVAFEPVTLPPTSASAHAAPPPSEPPERPVPAAVFVLGGVGVVGVGAFAFFGLGGKSKQGALDDARCKPACAPSDVDAVKRDYRFADISLAVSVLALGAATYFFVTRPETTPQPGVSVGAMVTGPRDGAFSVRLAF